MTLHPLGPKCWDGMHQSGSWGDEMLLAVWFFVQDLGNVLLCLKTLLLQFSWEQCYKVKPTFKQQEEREKFEAGFPGWSSVWNAEAVVCNTSMWSIPTDTSSHQRMEKRRARRRSWTLELVPFMIKVQIRVFLGYTSKLEGCFYETTVVFSYYVEGNLCGFSRVTVMSMIATHEFVTEVYTLF